MNLALFSSVKDNWETPQAFFDKLNEEFRFTLDACASAENAKCRMFFTTKENGLVQDWEGHVVFVNPPYGRKISAWVEKCYEESRKKNTKVVMLLPACTVQSISTSTFLEKSTKYDLSKGA